MMPIGKFITLDGGEGAGKSTQASLLARRLEETGCRVMVTREPGGTPFAERLRHVLLEGAAVVRAPSAEALAFYAARMDHLEMLIRPALDRGDWVICDRFSDSTRVYQGIVGQAGLGFVEALEQLVVGSSKPDLTFVLDLDPAKGLARAEARRAGLEGNNGVGGDPFESRDIAYHSALREGFLKIAREEKHRCVVVDASEGVQQISDVIWRALEERLLGGGECGAKAGSL